jgi:hypothetical protein
MGKEGHAFTLVLPDQLSKLRDIQDRAGTRIRRQITPRFKERPPRAPRQHEAEAQEPESAAGNL